MSAKVSQSKANAYTIEFQLPGLPRMTNSIQRRHWAVQKKHTDFWKSAVRRALAILNKPPQPLTSAALTLTRYSSRAPDPDGLVSSFKAIKDSLVEEGVLAGDSLEIIGMPDYRWQKCAPGKGKVHVRVEDLSALKRVKP